MKTITTKQAIDAVVNADRVYMDIEEVRVTLCGADYATLQYVNYDTNDEWYGTSWEFELDDDFIYRLEGNKIYAEWTKAEPGMRSIPEEITLFKELPYCPIVEQA